MFETGNYKLAAILEAVPALVNVPTSALKTLREGRHQTEIALQSGVSQAHISELESGKKSLTPAVAAKLAPVFACEAGELLVAERVCSLKRLVYGAGRERKEVQRQIEAIEDGT
jgi:transcriptional regulator with XRE-family HTH domain